MEGNLWLVNSVGKETNAIIPRDLHLDLAERDTGGTRQNVK